MPPLPLLWLSLEKCFEKCVERIKVRPAARTSSFYLSICDSWAPKHTKPTPPPLLCLLLNKTWSCTTKLFGLQLTSGWCSFGSVAGLTLFFFSLLLSANKADHLLEAGPVRSQVESILRGITCHANIEYLRIKTQIDARTLFSIFIDL